MASLHTSFQAFLICTVFLTQMVSPALAQDTTGIVDGGAMVDTDAPLAPAGTQQNVQTEPQATPDTMNTQETVDLFVGDIFEIIASHNLTNPTYTWILTQDRTFMEAGRTSVFRRRIIQPGRYMLYAEVSSGETHLSRTFILDYKARTPGTNTGGSTFTGTGNMIVQTTPLLNENSRAVIAPGSQLIKLQPVQPDIRPIVLDANTGIDTNADGNPANDIDSEPTFFQKDASPLYVWITAPLTTQSMTITAARPEGALVQRIDVLSESYAREQGLVQSPLSIQMTETGERTYTFKASFTGQSGMPESLLYEWQFGDGQQSLETSPMHEYSADGNYEVTLTVRNLENGTIVGTSSLPVDVQAEGGTDVTPDETDDEEPATDGPGFMERFGTIFLLVGVFLGSIIAGIVIIYLFSRFQKRGNRKSLSDTLEAMENTIVKKDDGAKAPPPLTITQPKEKQTTPPPSIAQKEEQRATTPLSQKPLTVQEKNAPAWLKTSTPAPAPAAPQTPPPAPKPATPPPAPKPATPPAPQPPKPVTPPPAPKPQTPPVPPAPQAPKPPVPTPPPAPKPVTPPAQPQQARPVTVPPWLQSAGSASVTTPPVAPQTPPASLQAPKPVAPPVPAATPMMTPPPVMPAPPKPVAPPTPVVTPPAPTVPQPQVQAAPAAPVSPVAPAPTPATPPAPQGEQPIAFIRADSLEQKPQTPPAPPTTGGPAQMPQ